MAYSTGLIVGIYLLLMFMFLFIWYLFCETRSKFWENRSAEPPPKLVMDPDNFERRKKLFEPRASGKQKFKPKWNSDAKLYELEHNAQKQ